MCKKRIVQVVICLKPDVDEHLAKEALKRNVPSLKEITSQKEELRNIVPHCSAGKVDLETVIVLHCSADKAELEKVFKTQLTSVKKRPSNLGDSITFRTAWESMMPFIIPDSLAAYINYVIVYHPSLAIG